MFEGTTIFHQLKHRKKCRSTEKMQNTFLGPDTQIIYYFVQYMKIKWKDPYALSPELLGSYIPLLNFNDEILMHWVQSDYSIIMIKMTRYNSNLTLCQCAITLSQCHNSHDSNTLSKYLSKKNIADWLNSHLILIYFVPWKKKHCHKYHACSVAVYAMHSRWRFTHCTCHVSRHAMHIGNWLNESREEENELHVGCVQRMERTPHNP